MNHVIHDTVRDASLVTLSLLAWQLGGLTVEANPTGGSATSGSATFNSSGSQLTVHTSASAIINWSSFNIGLGETTTFVQPSSASVVWNHINDANPSQILGNLNANGYVILQNANGFYIGGSASLNTAGLVLTTSGAAPTLSSGVWQFNALPPTASIINYGQITAAGGGSAYLIANNIENHGTIAADQGQVGLYAGKEVLVSTRPDGRGLNAKVTLPQGSVDNQGRLIADGGSILMQARTVNSGGLIQANTVQDVNGTIELLASDSVNLGASSAISAQGAGTGVSAGGRVTIKSDNAFSDATGSTISVAGGAQGGQGGQVEVSALRMGAIQSHVDGHAAAGYAGGKLILDPSDIQLDATYLDGLLAGGFSTIDVSADHNIEINDNLSLGDASSASVLNLTAGNSIIVDANMSLVGGNNWTLNLVAGTAFIPSAGQPTPAAAGGDGSYNYGVYLDDGAYVQTQNTSSQPSAGGNINIWAANEVIIHEILDANGKTVPNAGAIRTLSGGNISVTAQYGNVDAGNNVNGYDFGAAARPYYNVDAQLGGISTAAGGNVSIQAGGNVTSYLPSQYDLNAIGGFDGGSGAYGPEAGNVSITAGGSVYGNYVVANGTGAIQAGGNAGAPVSAANLSANFALSLIKGSWHVNAQNIYLDGVMNPNGVFNNTTSGKGKAGYHYFDYDSAAAVSLNAANAVEITGADLPWIPDANQPTGVLPVLFPPSLQIVAGTGGVTLDTDVILFPSAQGNLNITTLNGGDFSSRQNPDNLASVNQYTLEMSDSARKQWTDLGNTLATEAFGIGDQSATPLELNNPNTVEVNVSGSMNYVNLYATMRTTLAVDGNMFDSSFVGKNLHASDVTSVNVKGSISYSPIYTFVTLSEAVDWNTILGLLGRLVDVTPGDAAYVGNPIPTQDINNANNANTLKTLAAQDLAFQSGFPSFVYDAATKQLGYQYQMNSLVKSVLDGTLEVITLNSAGVPQYYQDQNGNYYFRTTTVSLLPTSAVDTLFNNSQSSLQGPTDLPAGFQIGGPGKLVVSAGALDLGASGGIVSWGSGDGGKVAGGVNYASLGALTDNAGAAVEVDVNGNLGMLTSTIASVDGGTVTVNCGAEIDLGLAGVPLNPVNTGNLAFGIYSAGAGDVRVVANGDINIETARIATFNGGDIYVESLAGNVNAGNGANVDLLVPYAYYDAATRLTAGGSIQDPRPSGSGILSIVPSVASGYQVTTGEQPGDITVNAYNNITSTLGGISQFALDNTLAGGVVTLTAGNLIDGGQGGVLGGTVYATAKDIKGLFVSRQSSTIKAENSVNITLLAGGNGNVSGSQVSGTLITGGGLNVAGNVTAAISSENVSANGSQGQNTLGNATQSAASQSAANQSGNDTKQTLAKAETTFDDEKNKKKHGLMQRVKRVTVLLPKT